MKKLTLSLLWMFCSTMLFSQVYRLEPVFADRARTTYLSYWKLLEGSAGKEKPNTFSLWGYQSDKDNWATGTYEVEYFKGNAAEMYRLLKDINVFSEKYGDEDKVLTEIEGVRVQTFIRMGFKYTLVFDKENRSVCMFTRKQWKHILAQFESFCKTNQIGYERR
ncbi:hypothetical protein [Niabella aurantiaca]|uniref:hypothetical protein n=1 Tax=Niabella aurantiaca TaxID=379900 RepID=UPI0003A0DF03|nr:hypothetical protein [Niabella aurantiaca]